MDDANDLDRRSAPSPEWMTVPSKAEQCSRCAMPLGATYWAFHGKAYHLECVDWGALPRPPYAFRTRELRLRDQQLRDQLRALEHLGRTLVEARQTWPEKAGYHVARILRAVRRAQRAASHRTYR